MNFSRLRIETPISLPPGNSVIAVTDFDEKPLATAAGQASAIAVGGIGGELWHPVGFGIPTPE